LVAHRGTKPHDVAAAVILQDFLEARRARPGAGSV
jgi:hypothetical protein